MAKKLFVGNLPYNTTNEDLAQHFAQWGEVSNAFVMMDKVTGRSRGYGFVEMPNDDEADTAIAKANGADLGGRALTVDEARPKPEMTNA